MFWRVVMCPLFSGTYFSITFDERIHLLGRDAAEGQLHADHLHVGLALTVDALLEAELDEFVFGDIAREEPARLGLEVVELLLEYRDHVPRHVLHDLRVLERAALGGDGTWLHGCENLLVRTSSVRTAFDYTGRLNSYCAKA